MNTERDLLYGVLALQADLINTEQFVEACTAWSAEQNGSLGELLVGWGYVSPTDHKQVEYLLNRRLAKHSGDMKACLAHISDDRWRDALRAFQDPYIQQLILSVPMSPAANREKANASIHEIDLSSTPLMPSAAKLSSKSLSSIHLPTVAPARQPAWFRIGLGSLALVVLLGVFSATILLSRERDRSQQSVNELEALRLRAEEERDRATAVAAEVAKMKAENDQLRLRLKGSASGTAGTPPVAAKNGAAASPVVVKREDEPVKVAPAPSRLVTLQKAVAQRDEEVRNDPQNVDRQFQLATACRALADEQRRLGDAAAAETAYLRAAGLSEMLSSTNAQEHRFGVSYVECLLAIGRLLKEQGKLDAALASAQKAFDFAEPRFTAHPSEVAVRRACTQALLLRGEIRLRRDLTAEVESDARKVLTVLDEAGVSNEAAERACRAGAHDLLGQLLARDRRLIPAEAAYRRALDLREALARDHADNAEYQQALAASHQHLAEVYAGTSRLVQAEAAAQRAFGIRDKHLRAAPAAAEPRRQVAQTQRTLASIHLSAGRYASAETELRNALKALEETAKGAGTEHPAARDLAAAYYELAGLFAAQSGSGARDARDQHAVRAFDALEKARTAGFFHSTANEARLMLDPHFDFLRRRDEFKRFVDGLGTASGTNA